MLSMAGASAQEGEWEGLITAGQAALQQQNFTEAEQRFETALATAETFPSSDPRLGKSLNNLAAVYYAQEDHARAEPLMRRSIGVLETALGPDNPEVAQTLKNLAALYYLQGKLDAAEPLLQRALDIFERSLGPNHAYVATVLSNLAGLYQAQDRYAEAAPLLDRSLKIWESLLGPNHPDVAQSRVLLAQVREAEAEAGAEAGEPQEASATTITPAQQPAARQVTTPSPKPPAPAQTLAANQARTAEALQSILDNTNDDKQSPPPATAVAIATPPSAVPSTPAAASEPAIPPASLSGADAPFAVHLSTLWSSQSANSYWQGLQAKLPDLLGDKQLEMETVAMEEGRGAYHRVLTGPFPNEPDASALCDEINARLETHNCTVVPR